jgi:hypothetical protein
MPTPAPRSQSPSKAIALLEPDFSLVWRLRLAERLQMRLQGCVLRSRPMLKRPLHHRPRKSLRIRLAENLSDPVERAIAFTIAEHLSAKSGQHVSILDLVGYVLYVWSDRPLHSPSALAQSIEFGCPLQGWLVGKRSPNPAQSGGTLAGAVRLELVAIAS